MIFVLTFVGTIKAETSLGNGRFNHFKLNEIAESEIDCDGLQAEISGDSIICSNTSTLLWANIYSTSGSITSIQWKLDGNVIELNGDGYYYRASIGGDYTVTFTNSEGCTYTSEVYSITVNAAPSATISGKDYYCQNVANLLESNAVAGSGSIESYQWQLDYSDLPLDANSSNYTVTDEGFYQVVVTNSNGCSYTSSSHWVHLFTVEISGDSIFCNNNVESLFANSNGPYNWDLTYDWKVDNEIIISNSNSAYFVTDSAGVYSVLISNSDGCSYESEHVSVLLSPTVSIDGDNHICEGDTIILESSASIEGGSIYSYQWELGGDSILVDGSNSIYQASADGVYSIVVTGGNGCSTRSSDFILNKALTAEISGDSIVCDNNNVIIYSNASVIDGYIDSYQWKINGENVPNSGNSASYVATLSGNYTVNVNNSNGCSITTDTFTLYPFSSSVVGQDYICEGDSIALTNTITVEEASVQAYQWKLNGNNIIDDGTNDTLIVIDSGYYSVELTSSSGCSMVTDSHSVSIQPIPQGTVTETSLRFCEGDSSILHFNASANSGSVDIYQWMLDGDSIEYNANSDSFIVRSPGDYSVLLTSDNACSNLINAFSIIVDTLPISTINGINEFCDGDSSLLSFESIMDGNHIAAYQWIHNEDSIIDNGDQPTIMVKDSGDYSLLLTSFEACTYLTEPYSILLFSTPEASISGGETFCNGDTVVLHSNAFIDNGTIDSYQWLMNGDRIDSIGVLDSLMVTMGGDYSIELTSYSACSSVTDPLSITVNALPITEVYSYGFYCDDDSVVLNANASVENGNIEYYQWKLNGVDISENGNDEQYLASISGAYSVDVVTNDNCSVTSSPVEISSVFEYEVSGSGSYCEGNGPSIDLYGSQVGLIYILYQLAVEDSSYTIFDVKNGTGDSISFMNVPNGTFYIDASVLDENFNVFCSKVLTELIEIDYETFNVETIFHGSGVVSSNQSGNLFCEGTDANYEFNPNTGYELVSVIINDEINEEARNSGAYTFESIDTSHSIFVEFACATVFVELVSGENGSIIANQDDFVCVGMDPTYSIVADGGYTIEEVFIDGELDTTGIVESGNLTLVNIQSTQTISATFVACQSYSITASAGVGGSMTPVGVTNVCEGGTVEYFFEPENYGYSIEEVLINGISDVTDAVNSGYYVFEAIDTNQTIEVTFGSNTCLQVFSLIDNPSDQCVASSAFPIYLDGSEIGVNYQLYQNHNPISDLIVGTGDTLFFGTYEEGYYSIEGTNGACTEWMDNAISNYAPYAILDTVIDFNKPDSRGVMRSLFTELSNDNAVILSFCTGWCPSCGVTNPILEEVYQESCKGSGNIKQWGILTQDGYGGETDNLYGNLYSRQRGISFPIIANSIDLATEYNITSIPSVLVIIPDSEEPINSQVYKFEVYSDDLKDKLGCLLNSNGYPLSDVNTINANFGPNGIVLPFGKQIICNDGDQSYSILANDGYKIEDVFIDGVSNTNATKEGTYTFTNINEAHSINVSFVPCDTSYGDTSVIACGSYTWHDSTYFESTDSASYTLMNSDGCDSVVTLDLTIYSMNNVSSADTSVFYICKDSQVTIDSVIYSDEGVYELVKVSQNGCDSIYFISIQSHETIAYSIHVDNSNNGMIWIDILDYDGEYEVEWLIDSVTYNTDTIFNIIPNSIAGAFIDSNNCYSMIDTTIGIQTGTENTITEGKLRVYPNPASRYLMIELIDVSIEPAVVKVYSILGQTLLETDFERSSVYKLNLESLSEGVYLVEVEIEGEKYLRKFKIIE